MSRPTPEFNVASRDKQALALLNYMNPTTTSQGAGPGSVVSIDGTIEYADRTIEVDAYRETTSLVGLIYVPEGVNATNRLMVAGGREFSGGLSGDYTWTGVQLIKEINKPTDQVRESSFTMTTRFNGGRGRFQYESIRNPQGTGITDWLWGSGWISAADGRLESTIMDYYRLGIHNGSALMIGRLHGDSGAGVSGVVRTSNNLYLAGFIGTGPQSVKIVKELTGTAGIASGQLALPGRSAGKAVIVAANLDGLRSNMNHASQAKRDSAFLTKLAEATAGTTSDISTVRRVSGSQIAFDGTIIPVQSIRDRAMTAALYIVDGRGKSDIGSLIVSGGADLFGNIESGLYLWKGAHVWAADNAIHASSFGTFMLTADFDARTFTYKTTNASPTATLSGSGSVDIAAGSLTSTQMSFRKASGSFWHHVRCRDICGRIPRRTQRKGII